MLAPGGAPCRPSAPLASRLLLLEFLPRSPVLWLEALVSLRALDFSPHSALCASFTQLGGFQGKLAREEKISRIPTKLCSRGPIFPGPHQRCVLLSVLGAYTSHSACSCSFRVGAGPGWKRGGAPAAPHSGSDRPPVQSSLPPSPAARGAVLRLTTFRTKLRSRREDQLAHCCSSSSDFCAQSAHCCFLPESRDDGFSILSRARHQWRGRGRLAMDQLHVGGSRTMCSLSLRRRKGRKK